MKIILVSIVIMAPLLAMQPRYNPSDLFKAVHNQDQEEVLNIILSTLRLPAGLRILHVLLETQSFPTRRTPLLQAMLDNNVHSAFMLVNAGANVFSSDFAGKCVFYNAFAYNYAGIVKACAATRNLAHRLRMERWIFAKLKNADVSLRVEDISEVVNTLLTSRANFIFFDHNWLAELASRSNKAVIANTNQLNYAHVAAKYKAIAPLLIRHYKDQREQLMQVATDKNTYLSKLSSDLRGYILDKLHGSSQSHQVHLQLIQAMPEH